MLPGPDPFPSGASSRGGRAATVHAKKCLSSRTLPIPAEKDRCTENRHSAQFFGTPPPGFCRNAVFWPTGVHFYCTRGRFCGYLSLPGMQDSCRGIINEESQSIRLAFSGAENGARTRGAAMLRQCFHVTPRRLEPPTPRGWVEVSAPEPDCLKRRMTAKRLSFIVWSGKRGSDPRPQPWQGCALPTELFPQNPIA